MSRAIQMLSLICVFAVAAAHAQNVGASLKARVVDPAGAAVPAAAINLVNGETGLSLKASTDAEGLFTLPSVAAGSYRLEVVAAGFKTFQKAGIELTASEIR